MNYKKKNLMTLRWLVTKYEEKALRGELWRDTVK